MKSISFFSDKIKIAVHTATDAAHVGKDVSIREFAGPERVSLYETETGELMARTPEGRFIEGPEAV